jgi:hypothetical protein
MDAGRNRSAGAPARPRLGFRAGFPVFTNGFNPGRQQFGPVAIQGRRLNGKPAVSKTVFGGSNPSAPAMV